MMNILCRETTINLYFSAAENLNMSRTNQWATGTMAHDDNRRAKYCL